MIIRFIKEFIRFLIHIKENKRLLYVLAINDFKEQFLGSYLGLLWAVLRPLLFILTIWFVFTIGFKHHSNQDEIPFIVYLLTGYIPWFFFSEALTGGMNSVVYNRFLVKKVAFRVSILPIVKIISALFLHCIFIIILIVVLFLYGLSPSIYWLQLPFYMFALILLLLGLGWMLSALRVFIKDISQLIGVLLQLGFWVTPIFWSLNQIPQRYMSLMELNPMMFIVKGYRNTFIEHQWFWEDTAFTFSFGAYTLFFLVVGGIVFKRLRSHFGDVL